MILSLQKSFGRYAAKRFLEKVSELQPGSQREHFSPKEDIISIPKEGIWKPTQKAPENMNRDSFGMASK